VATSQRLYESACPGCGAAVSFRSAASTHAVCGYCQTTVVRKGDVLESLGKVAQIFDNYSPLQLYAQGEQGGKAFTLIGRLQYDSPAGRWTEWLALFDDGRSVVLSEDNGSFVWLAPMMDVNNVPDASRALLGSRHVLLGYVFSVTAAQRAQCIAAQGEFSQAPVLNQYAQHAELRSADGKLLTIDYASTPPSVYLGKAVELDTLKLTGLKDSSSATLQGRQFNCPNCASPVSVQLELSKSVTCPACNSAIDLSQGVGGELRHALQHEPIRPQIALGTVGTLAGKQWQVVGYQHRMSAGNDDSDEDGVESFGWEEYLLYNAKAGFQFLVDATDGWSLYKTATGAPKQSFGSNTVSYLGTTYRHDYTCRAYTDYVAGEFYWPLKRDDKTFNTEYSSGKSLLSCERSGQEITWSVGTRVDHTLVMQAFGVQSDDAKLFIRDANPISLFTIKTVFWTILCIMIATAMLGMCSTRTPRDCSKEYDSNSSLSAEQQREQCERSKRNNRGNSSGSWGGGSYGGYSSGGGGHK
jgi:Domain of unknown function (DUF4178)